MKRRHLLYADIRTPYLGPKRHVVEEKQMLLLGCYCSHHSNFGCGILCLLEGAPFI